MSTIIEAPKVLQFGGESSALRWSPDGKRYLLLVAEGDLANDGVWVSFLIGSTNTQTLQPRTAAKIFTRALGESPATYFNEIQWLGDGNRIAFLWEDIAGIKQVMIMDLRTGALTQATSHETEIHQFAVRADGRTIIYVAFPKRDETAAARALANGFSVKAVAAHELLAGNGDGWSKWYNMELFIAAPGEVPRKVSWPNTGGFLYSSIIEFSPDGEKAIITLPVGNVPKAWDGYDKATWIIRVGIPSARQDPRSSNISQLYTLDLSKGAVKPLLDAPLAPHQRAKWMPDSRRVIVGPAFLPIGNRNDVGRRGSALAEVDTDTGSVRQLPFEVTKPGTFVIEPVDNMRVEVTSGDKNAHRVALSSVEGQWRIGKKLAAAKEDRRPVELQEGLNQPPRLVSLANATRTTLYEVSPSLKHFQLSRVEITDWTDSSKRNWRGRLYYPIEYASGVRYPLVIQTHGFSDNKFSLIGDDRFPSTFSAQALANKGMFVLQMGDPENTPLGDIIATPREGGMYMEGFEAAVRALESQGLIDPTKVGLSGFSRTGWHVEYALAHSQFPFAAGLAADNIDSSYFQWAIMPPWQLEFEQTNGAPPFGEGLKRWFDTAVGFNAHKIRAPIRLQVNSGDLSSALSQWELFSALKRLNKPVELYIVPNIKAATHNLQNPKQILASQGGAVDWFAFWLKGEIDPDLRKADQYARWEILKAMLANDDGAR